MIHAITADQQFIRQLTNSELTGIVHSTFTRTVNIRFSNCPDLYTLASHQLDNGPNTMIINLDDFIQKQIEVNDFIQVKENVLSLANKLQINIGHVVPWNSILPNESMLQPVVMDNLYKMKQFIDERGTGGGIQENRRSTSLFEIETFNLLKKRSECLMRHLSRGELDEALTTAISIVGLGPGLTPSGDDFLVGLFTAFNLKNSPCFFLRAFCEDVVKHVKPLTNEISYMALKKAATGEVRESIVRLTHAALNTDEHELNLALADVLKIGSSSGTDIALGLVAGLELNTNFGGK